MTPEQARKILAQPGMPKTSPFYRMALEALRNEQAFHQPDRQADR